MWCQQCGRQRLLARWTDGGDLWVDCPACEAAPMNGGRSCVIRTFDADQGIRPRFGDPRTTPIATAIRDVLASVYDASADGLETRRTCARCGGSLRTSAVDPDDVPPDLRTQCNRCGFIDYWGWSAASCSSHPLVMDWLDAQDRTRMSSQSFVTMIDNRPATFMRFESLTNASSITAWRDLATMKFVLIERDGIALDPATMP
jgi:ribosomal protein S27AE